MSLNKRLMSSQPAPFVASENFNVVTWTGNDVDGRAITVGFKPDLVWIKPRTITSSNRLFNSTRGATKFVQSDTTAAEQTASNTLQSFTSTGFTVGQSSGVNDSSSTYVAWCWKAGGGTTSTNSNGSLNTTVQANQDSGFSIIKYDMNVTSASAFTIGHGLSAAPELIFFNSLEQSGDTSHIVYPNNPNKEIVLDSYGAFSGSTSAYWNTTAPSNTVINMGTAWGQYNSYYGGDTIAYAFHSVEGFSKIGSYTGNGSANGPITEIGFEPAFVVVKRTDAVDSWIILDNKRDLANPRNNSLKWDETGAEEADSSNRPIDFLSNGFQIKATHQGLNANNGTYLYMAIAADPDEVAPTLADSFNIQTYTGDGGTQSITGTSFQPNFVWIKDRSATYGHRIIDSVTGADKYIESSSSGTQQGAGGNGLISFDTDGFTVGSGNAHNKSGDSFVAWAWKADDNEPTINDNGSIDSIVSANANAGFSISNFKGTGANATVGHGLSATPEFVIIKNLSNAGSWLTWHKDYGGGDKYIYLDSTNAVLTQSQFFNSTVPTSTVFSVGSHGDINGSGHNVIAYCFHSVTGYSKFGTYTGIASGNVTVTTGFRPNFVMVKCTSHASTHWEIHDSVRTFGTTGAYRLRANENSTDGQFNDTPIKYTSTGFYLDSSVSGNNYGDYDVNGRTYIYAAFKINQSAADAAGKMAFLVIAGGGAGGTSYGAGGGAGGLRTSYGSTSGGGGSNEGDIHLSAGTYTITVGAGGGTANNTATNVASRKGGDSSIAASSITTITSTGGGGGATGGTSGGSANLTGGTGGSGGGAWTNQGAGSGTSGQGYAGGTGANLGSYAEVNGGGGGASAVGQAGSSGVGAGDGGAGLAVSITGSSVTYAGGGGAGGPEGGAGDGTYGVGGAGGGGNGGYSTAGQENGTSGTANTGGGGGGASAGILAGNYGTKGAGGSGVVILRLLTSEYSGSTTGSPTVTTSGSSTIIKFTSSGTYVHS